MFNHPDSQLFYQDSVRKDWRIYVVEDDRTYENDEICENELSIEDPLCEDQNITLGSCVSAGFTCKVKNDGVSLKGKTLQVSVIVNGHTSTPVPVGVYIVEEDTLEDDEKFRSIQAHDAMKGMLEKDFAPWFNNLTFPMQMNEFRESFFEYAGVEQEEVTLCNDWVILEGFEITNSRATQRMIEEENELIEQRKAEAESDEVFYDYNRIDTSTYDPTKKTTEDVYTKVTPQAGANPKTNKWYAVITKGEYIGEYTLTNDTKVKVTYENPVEVTPHEGDNPKQNGWLEVNNKGKLEPTNDTTVDENKKYYTATAVEKSYFEKTTESYFNPSALGWYWYDPVAGKYMLSTDTKADVATTYFEKTERPVPEAKYKEVTPREGQSPAEENWYTYDSTTKEYTKTQHTEPQPGVTYYELSEPKNRSSAFLAIKPEAHTHDNPKEEHWYELDNDETAFVYTEDTSIVSGKTYYLNIWELNQADKTDIIEDQVLGSDILPAICEINGRFGHIGNNGVFRYVKLKPIDYEDEGLLPDPELYPDPNLYPAGLPSDQEFPKIVCKDVTCETYMVKKIDRLVICKEDGDAGYVYPAGSTAEGHNTYRITGNFIWYSFTDKEDVLESVGMNILREGIGQISAYTPCDIEAMGNPCLEVGDTLKVVSGDRVFFTYVLKKTLSNTQCLTDTIEAKGDEERPGENNIYNAIIELKGKSNVLTRNIDETRSEIIDVSENLSSLIEQTADSIKASVSKEIKAVEDGSTEKYNAAVNITYDLISQTVSKTVYDENQKEIEEWKSGIDIGFDNITATVENKLSAEGTGVGFRWRLLSTGFILEAMGGYKQMSSAITPVAVTPVGTENPLNEHWYEQVSGEYIGTQDTSVVSGKTYYISQENPHDLEWYEIFNGNYRKTNDTFIYPNKPYYMKRSASDYREVFSVTGNGVNVENVITTKMLNVSEVANIGMINAVKANIDDLEVKHDLNARNIAAVNTTVTNLTAKAITTDNFRSQEINASQITSGKISADRLDVETMFAGKWIGVAGISSSGITNSGTVTSKKFTSINGRSDPVMSANTPWNTVADLKVCQMQVSTPSGSRTIYYLGYNP